MVVLIMWIMVDWSLFWGPMFMEPPKVVTKPHGPSSSEDDEPCG